LLFHRTTICTDRLQKLLSFLVSRPAAEPFQKALNSACRGIVDHPHMGKAGMFHSLTISIKRCRAQDRTFSLAPSSSLLSARAEKRIVHFDQALKAISGIPILHCLANFVSHQPYSPVLLYLQNSLHLRDRDSQFVHRQVIEQPILFHQRRLCTLKNCSCCNTRLNTTILTVEQFSPRKIPCFVMSTLGAYKTTRPSLLYKVFLQAFSSGNDSWNSIKIYSEYFLGISLLVQEGYDKIVL